MGMSRTRRRVLQADYPRMHLLRRSDPNTGRRVPVGFKRQYREQAARTVAAEMASRFLVEFSVYACPYDDSGIPGDYDHWHIGEHVPGPDSLSPYSWVARP